jgi:hypothetical protein
MKRLVFGLAALMLLTTGSGCCCLSGLFGHGYGGYAQPAPYGAPAPACGSCGYGPTAPYGAYGPTGYAPVGTTAAVPTLVPTYAAINTLPVY